MSNLYKNAIADARKLREAAEQNAKNRIIDAVTPKLRQLIERQIAEGDDGLLDSLEDDSGIQDAGEVLDMMDDEQEYTPAEPEPMDIGSQSVDVDSDGLGSLEVVPDEEEEDSEEPSIEDESQNKSVHVNITVEAVRNRRLQRKAIQLVKALSEAKTRKQRTKIRKELDRLRQALIITENSQNKRLAKNIKVILKESTMRRRRNSWLFEGKDDAGAEEVEFDDAGFEEGDVDVDAIKSAVEDLAAAVGMEASDESGGDDDDLDLEDDSEDDDLDLDLEEGDDLDEGMEEDDEGMYEYGGMSEGEMEEDDELHEDDEMDQCENDELMEADADEEDCSEDDEVIEVNEAMLRRALRNSRRSTPRRKRTNRISESRRAKMRRARRRRRLREGEAKAMASQFGGGKLGKEMFVDVDENTLLNALAEELGSQSNASSATGSAAKMASHFGGGSIKKGAVMESRRRRKAAKALNEANKRATLNARKARAAQKELKESNLFNAKLLYVTKLMQQHTLNHKQQRAIIEAMDNAKTQREAKLLFTSLNESLNKRVSQNRKAQNTSKLNENVSRTGTSSRSLRSGQATNTSGVELDRWAVLAGIKK